MRKERSLKIVVVIAWAFLVLFLLGLGLKLLNEFVLTPEQALSLRILTPHEPKRLKGREILVFFADANATALVREKRAVQLGAGIASDAEALISELLRGPQLKGSFPTIPAETRLLNAYRVNETLVLDFTREIQTNHTGGSASEIMTVYSIVSTIVANLDEIKSVQILVEGNEVETLAGHLDISRPLSPDMKWLHASHYEMPKDPGDEPKHIRIGAANTLRHARWASAQLFSPTSRKSV